MVRTNALSAMGRMPYSIHLLFYPAAFAFYKGVIAPYREQSEKDTKQAEWDGMVQHRPVDPDLFNPFTPIPFHNSPEVKYTVANINMRNYISQATHYNSNEYVWRNYHDSFDHNNKKRY